MSHYFWTDWYSGWGWFLWVGFVFLFFSGLGNWGYTYRAHRKYEDIVSDKDAIDLLNERYARGDLSREEFNRIKSEISRESQQKPQKLSSATGTFKSTPV